MRIHAVGVAVAGLLGLAVPAAAEVTRFEPADPRNAAIADIAAAPRNAQGRVEAVADVTILRPADPARGNGTLLLEVPNRGRKLALPLFNESPTAADDQEAGNG